MWISILAPCVLPDKKLVLSKTETVMRLRSIAESVRLWAPEVSSRPMASGDLRWSRAWLEQLVDWLDHYTDELDLPRQTHVVDNQQGRWGASYSAFALIRFIMISRLVTDNANIRKMLLS